MKKKISAILVTILLCSVSGVTIALAGNQEVKPIVKELKPTIVPPIITKPRYPDIKIAKGVAVDKYTLETEPVVFLIINYQGEVNTYLFIDGEFYRITEIERSSSWETGTKIFKYQADDDSIMTVVIQNFDSYNVISIAADFKEYLINFEPIYKYGVGTTTAGAGLGNTQKPIYEEVVKHLKDASGINIEDIFSKPTGQITEWVE